MTWSTNDGVASTINLAHSSGAETMFILKRLLKNEGWTVLSSSDGTTYNGSGDQISSASSGANGMDNNYAWFRIEDPGSLREYVFQRGTLHYSWKWHYSASDGFTGGSPDATTIPTATDMQGLSKGLTTFQTIFRTSGNWVAHIAAQDAVHNSVYSWWCCCRELSSTWGAMLYCDAIDSTTTSNDDDPCVHIGTDDTPAYSTLCATGVTITDRLLGWMMYGETSEEWGALTCLYYYNASGPLEPAPTSNSFIIDPYDSLAWALSIPVMRHVANGAIIGHKGSLKYAHWNPDRATYGYGDLIQVSTDYWLVWYDLILPGWPDSTTPVEPV